MTVTHDPMVDERVRELTVKGWSIRAIAEELAIPVRRVQRARVRTGVARPPNGVPMTEEDKARARELLEEGAPLAEVARTLGRSHSTMQRHFPEYTWPPEQVTQYMIDCSAIARRGRRKRR